MVAVYTNAELGDAGVPCVWPVTDDMVTPAFPALAKDEVHFAGDAVAVVVAQSRYEAQDALEAIEVDYTPLPPVLDMEEALKDGADLVHADKGTNKCFYWVLDGGDYDATKAQAEAAGGGVFRRRYVQQRLIPNAMEPRAVVCAPMAATGEVTLWSSTQIPHIVRVLLALTTGIPEQKIRVIAPDVGGGFGSKLEFYREEIIATLVASRLGRPVKWTESRSEGYVATIHGRDQIQDLEITYTPDGKMLGLHVELLADMGAYLQIITPGIPLLGAFMYNAIYKFQAYHFGTTGVFSTKTPTDAYRGAGRPEATYAIERIVDDLAAHLDLDPLVLREKNWITHEEFPYPTISGLEYDSGNYEEATARAKELFGYDAMRAEQAQRRASNDPVQLGIGVSTFTEMCGLAPSRILSALKYVAGGWESSTVRVLPTGKVEVVTGTSPHGQGHATAWSQIAADALGVPFDDIEVIHGDTKMAPNGMDTYGSRSLVVGGIAVLQAAERVVEKARRIAAHQLECDPGDLEFEGGVFKVRGTPGAEKSIQAVAFEAFTAHDLPDGVEPTLVADSTMDPNVFSYPHGTHLCAVEVDTETGCREDPVVRRRRRHRQRRQPADRRGTGARRGRPGDRAGAVRGGRLRRGRQPGHRHDGRLPRPVRGRPADVRDRADDHSVDHQRARREGRRRGRHHRLDPGGRERRRRRAPTTGGRRHRDAVLAAERVAGPAGGYPCRRCPVIPASFDYVRPDSVDGAVAALGAGGEDAKVLAGGQSLIPLLRLRLAYPSVLVDLGGVDELRGVRDDGDAIVIGAMTTHDEVLKDPSSRRTRRCWRPRPAPSPTRPCGTSARSAARSPTPTRPGTCPRWRWRRARRWWSPVPVVAVRWTRRTSSATTCRRRWARTRCWSRSGCPSRTAGASTTRSSSARRRRGPWSGWRHSSSAPTARSRRPGSGSATWAATPVRAAATEAALAGADASASAIAAAAEHAADEATRPTDLHAGADYRRHLARVLTRRAVMAAAGV